MKMNKTELLQTKASKYKAALCERRKIFQEQRTRDKAAICAILEPVRMERERGAEAEARDSILQQEREVAEARARTRVANISATSHHPAS